MKPHPDFITRNIENKELERLLRDFSNNLSSCVDFGSNLVGWIIASKTLDTHDAVLLAQLRHFIEQIDACSELIIKSISEPCLILMRAAFESFLYSSYILKAEQEERGKSFFYFQLLEVIKLMDKLDCKTQTGTQTRAIIGRDDHLSNLTITPPPDLDVKKSEVSGRIDSSKYSSIKTEYERIKAANPRAKPKWYSLFGGPTSIETLANVTGNSGMYEIFYRHFSGFVHGTKALSSGIDLDGINQIRMPFNAQFVCNFSLSLCFLQFKNFIEYYCSNKMNEYLTWYMSMRDFYQLISKNDILTME